MKIQFVGLKQAETLLRKFVEFWLPRKSLDFDLHTSLFAYVSAQWPLFFVGLFFSKNMESIAGVWAVRMGIGYTAGVFLSMVLLRLGFINFSILFGMVNAYLPVVIGDALLGPSSSMWVYIIANAMAGNFFIRSTGKVRQMNNGLLVIALMAMMAINWFSLISPTLNPEYEVWIRRFGLFNRLATLGLVGFFVAHFYAKNVKYRKAIEQAAEALRVQLSLVSNLLNNMKQAVFAIGSDKKVVAPVSSFASSIFKKDITGLEFSDILFEGNRKSEIYQKTESIIDLSMGEDHLQWDIVNGGLPNEIETRVGGYSKTLKLSYGDLRDEQGCMDKLMVIVEDVTQIRDLEKRVKDEKEIAERQLQIVSQIFKANPTQVKSFFKNVLRVQADVNIVLQSPSWHLETIKKLRLHLHTLKGNARALGFGLLSSSLHNFESQWEQGEFGVESFREYWHHFIELFSEFQMAAERFVDLKDLSQQNGLSSEGGHYVNIRKENLNRFFLRLKESKKDHIFNFDEFIDREILMLHEPDLPTMLRTKGILVGEAAASLDKKIKYEINSEFVTLPNAIIDQVDECLTHILRNAVDHGIEGTIERERSGKSVVGQILVEGKIQLGFVQIIVVDDGGGLDIDKITQITLDRRILTAEALALKSPEELSQLIFETGFSTKDGVSEYSGRGVGLSAAKFIMDNLGGALHVESTKDSGCRFILTIPLSVIESYRNNKEKKRESTAV